MMPEGSSDVMSLRAKTVVRVAEASIGEASVVEARCAAQERCCSEKEARSCASWFLEGHALSVLQWSDS